MTRFLLLLFALLCPAIARAAPIDWWDSARHGGNSFNEHPPRAAYFDALAGYGATWVRLAPDKWPAARRDFLIGDADRYDGIPPADLATLQRVIADAGAAGLKVVVAPLSLPGDRWRQHNGDKPDDRLWRDKEYWQQAAAFWRDLAAALKGNAAVGALNIVNEPFPEQRFGLASGADSAAAQRWYAGARGTTHDLPAFYAHVIAAIRQVDPDVPIMVDGGWYAAPDAFGYWPAALADPAVLYAYHMYEPWEVTSTPNLKRHPPLPYPGDAEGAHWDAAKVAARLTLPLAWADAHGVPRTRLVTAEFGCARVLTFCPTYLEDVLSALDRDGVHWAFYAFREDGWDAMDYELGAGPARAGYWAAREEERPYLEDAHGPNPVFAPISRRLAQGLAAPKR